MTPEQYQKALLTIDGITAQLESLKALLNTRPAPEIKKATKPPSPIGSKYATASSLSADQLGPTPDLDEPSWPLAVPSHMLVNTDDPMVRQFRAIQVIGIMSIPLSGLKVLDFGCGDGFVSQELANNSEKVVGFDIRNHKSWASHNNKNLMLTTEWSAVVSNAPYDLVIGFDTFDHLENVDLDDGMRSLWEIMSPDSRAFFRFHPWTAKHGSHLYERCNKAYAHLVLTPDELAQKRLFADYNVKITRPFATYDSLFTKNGFSILKRKGHTEEVEAFFDDRLIDRINKVCYRGKAEKDAIRKIMALQFIDYTIKKASP